jgi:hypothetical protein
MVLVERLQLYVDALAYGPPLSQYEAASRMASSFQQRCLFIQQRWMEARRLHFRRFAVCPQDQACSYLVMPTSSSECFQIFVNALSRIGKISCWPSTAANHRCSDVTPPGSISFLLLPPTSHGVDPQDGVMEHRPARRLPLGAHASPLRQPLGRPRKL